MSYTYNADGTLASKTDANGNTETYTYDAYQRLTGIPDRQQTFTYDTCPANANQPLQPPVCADAPGQVVQATFGSNVGPNELNFEYYYIHTPAGKVSSKTLEVQSANHLSMQGVEAWGALAASYTYDSQGALTSVVYPPCATWLICGSQTSFTYTLDAMERPTGMTDQNSHIWASGATYNAANEPLYDGTATRTYNNLLQVTSIAGTGMNMTYNYSSSLNNGQITSSVDAISGETITYQYDALKRLSSATANNWGETYTYDGYGNLTQMAPTGTAGAPAMSLTVALDLDSVPTNRINATGVSYDNNGNQTAGFGGLSLTYDRANRLSAVGGSQSAACAYDSGNQRIYSRNASGNETIYFYGADGTKLATYTYTIITYSGNGNPEIQLMQQSENVYFLGKLISAEGYLVTTDRLGSVRSGGPGGLGYQAQFPYGVEYTLTANDREKYATYTRDSVTGLDYAMNRYYSSQWGRFLSPDPYMANNRGPGNPHDPGSWNRYAYTRNDPVNRRDPMGLEDDGPGCDEEEELVPRHLLGGWHSLDEVICDPFIPWDPGPGQPTKITLQEIDDCIYPTGTRGTAFWTLEVEYQVLANGEPVAGNETLTGYYGVTMIRETISNATFDLTAGGVWCLYTYTNCPNPAARGELRADSGTFWDAYAGNGTANQSYLLNGNAIPVVNYGIPRCSRTSTTAVGSKLRSVTEPWSGTRKQENVDPSLEILSDEHERSLSISRLLDLMYHGLCRAAAEVPRVAARGRVPGC